MSNEDYILVADDDQNDLQMTVLALGEDEAVPPLVAVRDGAEVLEYLYGRGEFHDRPSNAPKLLLLDLNMPRIDGWEVLRRIKADKRMKTIPVVVFTSSSRDSDVEQCYRLGANAYVVKPSAFEEFRDAVRAIRVFWTKRNQSPPAMLQDSAADTRSAP